MSEERERLTDNMDNEFGPETGFESESSVSDKAFFQAESVNPVAQRSDTGDKEEYAAEVAAPIALPQTAHTGEAGYAAADRTEREGLDEEGIAGRTLGYLALFLSLLSLFFPSFLGPVSAVVGFMAFVKGSKALGIWSILIGTIAFVSFLSTIPYSNY